jgi:hypothetical protein
MIELMFVEWISILTFIYTALLMFLQIGTVPEMLMILLLSVIWGLIVIKVYQKNSVGIILSVFLLAPIVYFKTVPSLIFFSVSMVIFLFYTLNHEMLEDLEMRFVVKSSFYYLIISAGIFWFISSTFGITSEEAIKNMWPFFILFIMSAVMYLRSLRHLEANLEHSKIRKSNIRYSLLMLSVYGFILFQDFKDEMLGVLDLIRDFIGFLLIPVNYLFRNYNLDFGDVDISRVAGGNSEDLNHGAEEGGEFVEAVIEEQPLVEDGYIEEAVFILSVMIIILIMFFVIKKLVNEKKMKEEEFKPEVEETRTFIKKEKKRPFTNVLKDFGRKTPKDQVRYYYRKHLNKIRHLTDILEHETTSEIQVKAEALDFEDTDQIRALYTEVRYGEHSPENHEVQRMKKQTGKVNL